MFPVRSLPISAALAALVLACVLAVRCDGGLQGSGERLELAPYMGHLQSYGQKLGYAIEGREPRLAGFYLDEIAEVEDEIRRRVPEHDGFPVANLIGVIAEPAVSELRSALAEEDWERATTAYGGLIDSCNRCHAATEHEFIVITEPAGPPPWNQEF